MFYPNGVNTASQPTVISGPPLPPTDYESGPPPPTTSNTYHQHTCEDNTNRNTNNFQSQQQQWALPPGWKIAHRDSDGRIYYWQMSTGNTSWSHPSAPLSTSSQQYRRPLIDLPFFSSSTSPREHQTSGGRGEHPNNASRHPDSHQCCALFSCIVFPPLGICALIHSCLTGRRWSEGRYGESYEHSRQAYLYSWWAVAFFLAIVVWQYVFVDGHWPDFGKFFE